MKKAIIFDLYGTLIDIKKKENPYGYLLSCLKDDSLTNRKKVIEDVITSDLNAIKFISKVSTEGLLNNFSTREFIAKLDAELENTECFPDTIDVLRRLSCKYKLYVLSNLATPYKYPYYNSEIDNYIENVFFSCEEKDKKPNPTFFHSVVEYSGLHKDDFLMIGDNPISDIKGAKNYGIDGILKDKSLYEIAKDL